MTAYYNENDPRAAALLKELLYDGLIAPGEVDTRSIVDVTPGDLAGFTQVHLFAGIGGWSLAYRLAGWSDDRPAWSLSCPCQPFSNAGKRRGTDDPRHLWPEARRLIAERRPANVFGEQVAAKDGRIWLSGVRADLETLDYAVGAADLCAASVAAPHIRQRLYWMADGDEGERGRLTDSEGRECDRQASGRHESDGVTEPRRDAGGMADVTEERRPVRYAELHLSPRQAESYGAAAAVWMGDSDNPGLEGRWQRLDQRSDQFTAWTASVAIHCLDGKFRRVPADETGEPEPALFPLAHGIPNRVGTLRGAGNAIVPPLAAEFIKAAAECFK